MRIKKILTMALATALSFGMASSMLVPNTVYAKELTETVSEDVSNESLDDNKTVGTAETAGTAAFSMDRSQMTAEQRNKYDQVMSGERFELKEGESVVIASDDEGVISIKCVGSSTDTNLARASWETSYQNYNIYKTILGKETLLATVALECSWYKNGVDGYIQNLKGTYIEKNSAWLCSWDDYKVALPYNHALWLNLVSLGSSYSIMLTADYNPFNETLSFSIGQ